MNPSISVRDRKLSPLSFENKNKKKIKTKRKQTQTKQLQKTKNKKTMENIYCKVCCHVLTILKLHRCWFAGTRKRNGTKRNEMK